MSAMNQRDSTDATEGREQSVRHRARVVKIGAEPLLFIEGVGEVRFAYRAVKKKPGEPRATIVVGDQVECRLTRATPPKAVSVRLLRSGPPPQQQNADAAGLPPPVLPPPPPPSTHLRRQQPHTQPRQPSGNNMHNQQLELSRSSTVDTSSADAVEVEQVYTPVMHHQAVAMTHPGPGPCPPALTAAYEPMNTQVAHSYPAAPYVHQPQQQLHHQHVHYTRHDPYACGSEAAVNTMQAPIPVARPLPSPVSPAHPTHIPHTQPTQPTYGAQYAAATYVQQVPPQMQPPMMQPAPLPMACPVMHQQQHVEVPQPPPSPPAASFPASAHVTGPPAEPSLLSALAHNQHQHVEISAGIDAEIDNFLRTVGAAGNKKDGEKVGVDDIAEFIAARRDQQQVTCGAQRGRDALPSDFARKGPRRVHSLPPPSREINV